MLFLAFLVLYTLMNLCVDWWCYSGIHVLFGVSFILSNERKVYYLKSLLKGFIQMLIKNI